MSDFTFLTKKQCFGAGKLDILKNRGTQAEITDFSVLLGGWVTNRTYYRKRAGYYWTKSGSREYFAHAFGTDDNSNCICIDRRSVGARPALPLSSIESIPTNGESGKRAKDGILEIEYGYYPQNAVPRDMQERLERAYLRRKYIKNKK